MSNEKVGTTTFSITILSITTLSIMIFSMMTLSIKCLFKTLGIHDIQHNWHSV